METFDLKKYVSKHLDTFNWKLKNRIRISSSYLGNDEDPCMVCEIEDSMVIYHRGDHKLYIASDRNSYTLELIPLYECKLDRVFNYSLIRRLNKQRRNLLKKEKMKEELKRMEKLPRSILRDYKIDDLLQD